MKRLLTIFSVISLMAIGQAFGAMSTYERCKIDVSSDVFSTWAMNKNKVPQKYKDIIEDYGNEVVTQPNNGTCTGVYYECKVGQMRKECEPCYYLLAEEKAKEQHTQDMIKEKCGDKTVTTRGASTTAPQKTSTTPTQQNSSQSDSRTPFRTVMTFDTVNTVTKSSTEYNKFRNECYDIKGIVVEKPVSSTEVRLECTKDGKSFAFDKPGGTYSETIKDNFSSDSYSNKAKQDIKNEEFAKELEKPWTEYELQEDVRVTETNNLKAGSDAGSLLVESTANTPLSSVTNSAPGTATKPVDKAQTSTAPASPKAPTNNSGNITQPNPKENVKKITITGTVKGQSGKDPAELLPGVNLSAKNTSPTIGTITDINGNFTLKNFPTNDTLMVSFMGYETQEFSGDALNSPINITLKANDYGLDEVIVEESITGKPCLSPSDDKKRQGTLPEGAESGTRKVLENGTIVCEVTKCKTGYGPKPFNNTCPSLSGPCGDKHVPLPNGVAKGNKGEKNGEAICIPTECANGYEKPEEGCVSIAGNCPKDKLPKHASRGHREYSAETGEEICVVDVCLDKYHLVDGVCQPELTKEQSAEKVNKLRENATAMKDKERSTENKLLGAAAIGATGIGGMQLASGLSEQAADQAAERDMTAYLATMYCDYGKNQKARFGETEIMLPGGNDLIPLYGKYMALASELKTTKEALGLKAGIESETVLNSANTGLYNNTSIGITGGAFTSVARALSDKTGADAAAWAKQKSDAESKTKTGLIAAGAGIIGGIAGNLALNTTGDEGKNIFGKTVAKNQADAINNKYAALAMNFKKLEKAVNALSPNPEPVTPAEPEKEEEPENPVVAEEPQPTVASTSEPQVTPTPAKQEEAVETFELSGMSLFEHNSFKLTDAAKTAIQEFKTGLNNATDRPDTYCVVVEGYTDRTGKASYNQTLSEKRANAVATELGDKIKTKPFGYGENDCKYPKNVPDGLTCKIPDGKKVDDAVPDNKRCDTCKRVTITLVAKDCISVTAKTFLQSTLTDTSSNSGARQQTNGGGKQSSIKTSTPQQNLTNSEKDNNSGKQTAAIESRFTPNQWESTYNEVSNENDKKQSGTQKNTVVNTTPQNNISNKMRQNVSLL